MAILNPEFVDIEYDDTSVSNVTFKKVNGVVTISIYGFVTIANNVKFVVPEAFRPNMTNILTPAVNLTGSGSHCFVNVNSNGNVNIKDFSNNHLGAGNPIYGILTFVQ